MDVLHPEESIVAAPRPLLSGKWRESTDYRIPT